MKVLPDLFEIDEKECLTLESGDCTIYGYHFDTFGAFKAKNFLVIRKNTPVLSYPMVYPDVLADMQGYKYTVATLPYAPFIRKHEDGTYSGMEVNMLKFLALKYNFT